MGEWTKERIEAAEKRCEKATAGPWRWWTSCSFRRLSSDVTGKDGDVAYACIQNGDGHPDIVISDDDMAFTEHARVDLPDALAEIKAAAVALDAEISRSDKAADRPYSLAERIEFVIAGLDREARRGDCAEDEVKRLTLRIQGLEQANREAHQAIAKSKAHIDAADRRGDHAAQDRDTYKRERDEAQTELARVLAHIATLPAWCAPIPPPGLRPAALGGECARCLARPGYHEGSCVCRMARTDVTPSGLRVLKAAEEWHNAASLGCPRDCSAWDKERRVGQAERELLNAVRTCHAKTDQDKAAQVTEDVIGQALTVASGAQAVESVAVASRETRLHALFEKFMPMLLEEQTRGELGITCPCGATATDYTVDRLNSKPVCADFPRCKSRTTDEHVGHRIPTLNQAVIGAHEPADLARRFDRAYLDALGKDPDDATDEDAHRARAKALGTLDRESLGRMVREAWVLWAREQPNPKDSWLVPWEGLSEPDKEVDRRIGETIARHALRIAAHKALGLV